MPLSKSEEKVPESPYPTIQASKLMQILLKVSTATLRTIKIPSGKPKITGGAMTVKSDKDVVVKSPKK